MSEGIGIGHRSLTSGYTVISNEALLRGELQSTIHSLILKIVNSDRVCVIETAILIAIAIHADGKLRANISNREIAKYSKVCGRTVRRHIKELAEQKILTVDHATDSQHGGTLTNVYAINAHEL